MFENVIDFLYKLKGIYQNISELVAKMCYEINVQYFLNNMLLTAPYDYNSKYSTYILQLNVL